MMASDHDDIRESIGLYVLSALGSSDRAAFEAHLAGCPECTAEVRMLHEVAAALVYAVPQVEPPAGLRDRVLNAVAPSSTPAAKPRLTMLPDEEGPVVRRREILAGFGAPGGWLAMAALLLLTAALAVYGAKLRQRVGTLEEQLREAAIRVERTERQLIEARQAGEGAQLAMAVLTAPDMRQVSLAGQSPAPRAAGRGFWSGTRGLVFSAADLPAVPAGRTYQLWYLTPTAPVSAGLFTPAAAGTFAATFGPPPAGRAPTGLAVSLEPEGGVPEPTGAIYLVGTTQ